MHASEHPLLAAAEAWLQDHRPTLVIKLEEAMSHLTDLIENGKKLAGERVALIADRDAEKGRADKAEAHAAELQAKIDADDKAAADAAAELDAEIAKESGVSADAPKAVLEKPADPVASTSPTGAAVTVDPVAGITTHTDAANTTTTVDHASGSATATDASGVAVEPAPAAVAEAVNAAADAGVTVPAAG